MILRKFWVASLLQRQNSSFTRLQSEWRRWIRFGYNTKLTRAITEEKADGFGHGKTLDPTSEMSESDALSMEKTREVLYKYGYARGEIAQHPDLLTISNTAVENYILIAKESGLCRIRPSLIPTFPALSKKKIISLRKCGLVSEDQNILQNYFKLLHLTNETIASIISSLKQNYNELSLMDLRLLVMEHFIAASINSSLEASRRLIVLYPRCKHRSFTWFIRNLELFKHHFKFSNDLILKHGYLLQGNPHNMEYILENVKTLGGKSLLEVVHKRPKILMTDGKSIVRMKRILQDHGISTEAIDKHPELFTLSAHTVEKRLLALESSPDLLPLKSHPRICRLLYYFKKVQDRLNYLNSVDISGTASLHMLSTDTECFSNYVKAGELKSRGVDLLYYLSYSLNLPKEEVRSVLSVHPHWLQVPIKYVKEVLTLLSPVFSKEQIKQSIPLLLYPKERILKELEWAKQNGDALDHPAFLNLVLYRIEKEFHFTGDGIWTNYHSKDKE